MSSERPVTLLIAALGGEGGGVLTDWTVAAATHAGLPVQSTSIPGVAQRTGATTYYIEVVPTPWSALGDRRPVLALHPGIGDVDIMVASELLEAGRAVSGGYVTRDRTLMISSTARSYLVVEKMAMGDGRYDEERLKTAIAENTQAHLLLDMDALSRRSGAMVNAVMLGVVAGCGRLPIPIDAFEHAIRADGKAVEANLRGFEAGLTAVRDAQRAPAPAAVTAAAHRTAPAVAELERAIADLPASAREIVAEGVRRLTAYQDLAYARRYLERLLPVHAADTRAGANGRLLRETARHLAVRMSYEDVIRVAQAKIDPARLARIAAELKVQPGEPFTVTEFLKPGIEEMCSLLPPGLARRILDLATRKGVLARWHWGMEIDTTSVSGYLRFRLLAKLRRFRPRSFRFAEEQSAIDAWLALIVEAARLSGDLALEVAECARLIKGYGDTHRRGSANYRLIERRIIRPAIAGAMPVTHAVDAVASARTAALVDPEGEALARSIEQIERRGSLPVAAE
ncbi:MAG: indolepyruvate oxidoreductase subunit beta family protein [Hyphomicrobiales bacterium]|nr:indolepyruvate oxidoreductase subunit beta family protein [Hyphomicrobiales bacterium]